MNREYYLLLLKKIIESTALSMERLKADISNGTFKDGNFYLNTNNPIITYAVKQALKDDSQNLEGITIVPSRGQLDEKTVGLPAEKLQEEIGKMYAHSRFSYEQMILVYFLLSQKQPLIDKLLEFIYKKYEKNKASSVIIKAGKANDKNKEEIDKLAKLLVRIAEFENESKERQKELVREFIDSQPEAKQKLSQYLDEDGNFKDDNSYEEVVNKLIKNSTSLEGQKFLLSNVKKELITIIKNKIRNFIRGLAKQYKKVEKSNIIRPTFQDQYYKPISVAEARAELAKYYDEENHRIISMQASLEGIKQTIAHCGYRKPGKEQQIITLFEYRFKYYYLSDEEFATYYAGLNSNDKEIEDIVNEIEIYHDIMLEDETTEGQENAKNTIKVLIEDLKQKIEEDTIGIQTKENKKNQPHKDKKRKKENKRPQKI